MNAERSWTLTSDSSISALNGDVSGLNINGYTLYVNGEKYVC